VRAGHAGPLLAIPNVSEGRDAAVIDAIGQAFASSGARLLDVHADPDHHRSVYTLAGAPGDLAQALVAGAREAIARVDLRTPRGSHPHLGALDVAPLVHLDARRGAACAEALVTAHELGRLGLPILLYGVLADRRTRAELRRGGIERLAQRMADGELCPDFGPAQPHPTAGATLVAARPPLIAFNVELESPATLEHAMAVAADLREGGPHGLPGVRAIGLTLPARDDVAQVSCNVEDHQAVPLAALVAAVAARVAVRGCELVGLAPRRAFAGFPDDIPVRNRRTVEDALDLDS
jgi:glutamate formiminotransferase/glutamate formiminotransferase/formiminotetrahydrofolate cyclodeaminase